MDTAAAGLVHGRDLDETPLRGCGQPARQMLKSGDLPKSTPSDISNSGLRCLDWLPLLLGHMGFVNEVMT